MINATPEMRRRSRRLRRRSLLVFVQLLLLRTAAAAVEVEPLFSNATHAMHCSSGRLIKTFPTKARCTKRDLRRTGVCIFFGRGARDTICL